jgi:AraC-like DNA-binding protein
VLRRRIDRVLAGDERLVSVAPASAVPVRFDPTADRLMVLDCRALTCEEALQTLLDDPDRAPQTCRVAIVSRANAKPVEVVGRARERAMHVLIAEHPQVGARIRALLNDSTGTASAAIALAALGPRLRGLAVNIAEVVLSSGCRVSSVSQLSSALGHDRSWLNGQVWRACRVVPKELVKLCQMANAVVLLRETDLSLRDIARAVGYGTSRALDNRMRETFGVSSAQIRDEPPSLETDLYLNRILDCWAAQDEARALARRKAADVRWERKAHEHARRQAGRQAGYSLVGRDDAGPRSAVIVLSCILTCM